eukprot:4213543-Pyramimonas_sp.AAC.1
MVASSALKVSALGANPAPRISSKCAAASSHSPAPSHVRSSAPYVTCDVSVCAGVRVIISSTCRRQHTERPRPFVDSSDWPICGIFPLRT